MTSPSSPGLPLMCATRLLNTLPASASALPLPFQAAILRDMRDKNIVQFVGVCMGRSEEGQPDEAMMIQVWLGGIKAYMHKLCLAV